MFMRAYMKTRAYMLATPAIEIAKAERSFFPSTDIAVLARCIASYQQLVLLKFARLLRMLGLVAGPPTASSNS
jgi:hypothetical protein